MCKLNIWIPCALLSLSAALRRGTSETVDLDREAWEQIMRDFRNLPAHFSQGDAAMILQQLKSVPVRFQRKWGNLTLPTGKDLPQEVPQRCAIVSSSRSVLEHEAGKDIDAVDGPVMRMNNPFTQGWEAVAGSRTDALVINNQVPCMWIEDERGPPPQVKMVIVNNFGRLSRVDCLQKLVKQFPKVPFFVLDYPKMQEGLRNVMHLVAEKGPVSLRHLKSTTISTTGMLGGLFMMNLCKEVFHYGFLESNPCREHYWDEEGDCITNPSHDLTKEHLLWKVISSTEGVQLPGEGIVYGWPRLQTEG